MSVAARITALAYGGTFVGDVVQGPQETIGKRAFVPFTAPGELVEIRVLKEEKRFLEAEAVSIIERSPSRIAAPCPYYTICGGCDLQHLPIAEQRALKVSMIESTLRRQGGVVPTRGVKAWGAELPGYGYRRRITLHLSPSGEFGFFRAGSGEVIPIDRCLIASAPINDAILKLRPFGAELKDEVGGVTVEADDQGGISILLLPRDGMRLRGAVPQTMKDIFPLVAIQGKQEAEQEEHLDGTGHFSQVNEAGNKALIKIALEWLTGPEITDLYAGSGNFSLPLAADGRTVTAVELDRTLASLGTREAERLGLAGKVSFNASSCEQYLKRNHPKPSVLLDPPRSGAKEVVKRLEPARTVEIVYISCNLPSLTRDLQILSARGYEVVETIFVDMFAQTHHVETATLLRAR